MSTNGNGWKPRKDLKLTCPSGQEVTVRRPGPEFILKSGKVARTFSASLSQQSPERQPGQSIEQYGMDVIARMSDEELAALMIFARELVCTMLVSPKLVLNPRPEMDEIGPDDIGNDFWWLFNYAMSNFLGIRVPVGETEVEAKDLETFRPDASIQGDSMDSTSVSVTEPERAVTDSGLVGSAGA